MDHWNDYLAAIGSDDTAPAATAVNSVQLRRVELSVGQLASGFVAVLDGSGLIGVTGDDGASFLHGQLTNDVLHLGTDEARMAGYCSPKGRLLASLLLWRSTDTIYMLLPRALQPALQKRLSMFVMRAKARLQDVGDGVVMLGLGGAAAASALQSARLPVPAAPYARLDNESGTMIRLADAFGAPRFLWLTAAVHARAAIDGLRAHLSLGGEQAWALSSIHAGVPEISVATQEQFVPQMVNFELLGAVNFKKGCYPGQEIVARSQYLGKLKRRTALATVAGVAAAGMEVFAASDPSQPCGMVVNAAANGAGGTDLLVELKLAVLDGTSVHLGGAVAAVDGPADATALRFLPMPYPLDAIEV